MEQRQYARADSTSLVALEKNPSEPAALALRGEILVMKGQVKEGTSLLQHAWQIPFVALIFPGGLALFTALVAVLAVMLFGLAPALRATRPSLAPSPASSSKRRE